MTDHKQDLENNDDDNSPVTFLEMMGSVLGAFVGIQSQAKRERDFKRMKPHHVIIAGIMLMILFFTTVMLITRALLATY
jgi:diacylglycerol kinase